MAQYHAYLKPKTLIDKVRALAARVLANDTVERAFRTFVQAAVAQVVVLIPVLEKGVTPAVVFAAVTSALAAGISAAWNGVVKPWLDAHKVRDEKGISTLAVVVIVVAVLFILGYITVGK